MKRLLTVLTVLTTIISYNNLYSQDKPVQEHLTFMGIPIDGKPSDFVKNMKNKEFTCTYTDEKCTVMKGTFAGNDVDVRIYATPKSKTVYQVIVSLPESKDWNLLEQDYKKYKVLLSNKYGKPTTSKEAFEENACIPDNYFKLLAVKNGECNFYSVWNLSKGYITNYITIDKETCIGYRDKINDKLNDKESEEDV